MNEFENIKGSLLPYDHQEIETVLKQVLLSNGITDILYEGSNVSQLSSIISYLISSLNVNTAINLQETILPLASKRMNILFGARQLGYEPHAIKSYKYELTIKPKISPDLDLYDTTEQHINIYKNTKFISGDKSYWYVGPTLVNAITYSNYDILFYNDPSRGKPKSELTITIPVIEGDLISYEDDPDGLQLTAYNYIDENNQTKTKQDYLIPYKNVEDDYGLQVYLSYINDDGYTIIGEEWKKSDTFLIDENLTYNKNKFIRKENIILGYPTIFFEFAGFGNKIRPETKININVLQSNGPDGEASEEFIVDDTVLSEMIEIIDYKLLERGIHEESNENIKENAIVFNNTANRAVTRYDYKAITKRHPLVGEIDAWGGEEEIEKQIGNIWISCVPENNQRIIKKIVNGYEIEVGTPSMTPTSDLSLNWQNWYLTDENYKILFDYLDAYKILTMQINKRHPLYIDFEYFIDIVKYDSSKKVEEVHAISFNAINEYFINTLEKYDSEYLTSNMQRILDIALDYNTGVNLKLNMYGVLCEQMIDTYYLPNKYIITNLSFPFENILNDNNNQEIDLTRIPKIDTLEFGPNKVSLYVDYSALNDDLSLPKRISNIYFNYNGNVFYFGEYIIDLEKQIITLKFDFDDHSSDPTVIDKIKVIFGNEILDENGNTYRNYARFNLTYPPHNETEVNIPFSQNRIPRLKKVLFNID